MTKLDKELTSIARKHLGLTTLEPRHSDGLDFSEQSVGSIKRALEAAFVAGQQSAYSHIAGGR